MPTRGDGFEEGTAMISDIINPSGLPAQSVCRTVMMGMLLIPFLNGAKQRDAYRDQAAECHIVRIMGTIALQRPAKPRGAGG
jgi:hypothetical protein